MKSRATTLSSFVVALSLTAGCRSSGTFSEAGRLPAFDAFVRDRPAAAEVLDGHPELAHWLARELAERAPGYRYQLVWSDQAPISGAAAEHARDMARRELILRVSADLAPVDQVLALSFEAVNAKQLFRFVKLENAALAGRISREEFIDRLMNIEYNAVVVTRRMFPALCPLPEDEATPYYRGLVQSPLGRDRYHQWLNRGPDYQAKRARYGVYFDDVRRFATQGFGTKEGRGKDDTATEQIAPHKPPPRVPVSDDSDDRMLDSLPAPDSSGGR